MKLLRLLRVYQWSKNLLVFVPLIAAHKLTNPAALALGFRAFFSLCLCASAGYVLNDYVDAAADRRHQSRKHRPFASGEIPANRAWALAPLLVAAGLMVAASVGREFLGLAVAYLVVTAAYSLRLKQVAIVDLMVLAGLYTIRVLAGGAATHIAVSPWLLALSTFLFLSIALAKRCAELKAVGKPGIRVRGYSTDDFDQLARFGTVSGYLAALVLALYIQTAASAQLYSRPPVLWGLCPLVLLWISRLWLLASRGELPEDPVMFTLTDGVSYLTLAGAGLVLAMAT
jgi:4-hydroxybenzoate polyprenyltransferase